jgi:AbrB family looped-hinge helix DNA binding protein
MGAVDQKKFSIKVTSKGQMTIPADVREALGISAGDRLELALNGKGGMELVKKSRSYKDIVGSLSHLAKNRTVPIGEEVDYAVEQEMLEQDLRSRGSEVPKQR